jgi:hypothetical protein
LALFSGSKEGGKTASFLRGNFSISHIEVLMLPTSPNVAKNQEALAMCGQCGVEVEGGNVPTLDWLLNLQILTSGGFQ